MQTSPKSKETMAPNQEDNDDEVRVVENTNSHKLEIPTRRVKNIMKLDRDISRVNSEALFLIASSTELFLQFLAEKSAAVAIEKKKRTVRLEHLRLAAKRHRPTADFLLSCLPKPPDQNPNKERVRSRVDKNPVPFATKSIDAFFQKSV